MNLIRHFGLVFSDAGFGILTVALVTTVAGVPFELWHLALGILFAYIPDIDIALDPHFWKTGDTAAYAGNPYDHREGLHKPILWWLAISGWGIIAPGVAPVIAFIAVTCHFLHDTVGTGWGMPWLWPLTKRRFKFFATKQNELSFSSFATSWTHEELPHYIVSNGRANWKEHYYSAWTAASIGEATVAILGAVTLVFLFL